jgi:hypothetical protein
MKGNFGSRWLLPAAGLQAALFVASLFICTLAAVSSTQAQWASWDQQAHIRKVSAELATRVRAKGANTVAKEIAQCYRDHQRAYFLTQDLERCVIQDAVHSWVTASVFRPLAKDTLQKMNLPSPEEITDAMSKRVVAVFREFKIPEAKAHEFMRLVRELGLASYAEVLQKK